MKRHANQKDRVAVIPSAQLTIGWPALFVGVVVAFAVLLISVGATRASAEDGVQADLSPLVSSEDPAIQAMAAQAYAEHFNVSIPTAYERVVLQDATAPLLKDLVNAIGADYGGAWYDAADGGKLKIGVAENQGSTDSDAVDAAQAIVLDAGEQAAVEFVPVEHTISELVDAQRAVDDALAPQVAAENVQTTVDVERNAVVVETTNDLSAADDAAVTAAVSEADTPAVVQQTDESSFHAEQRSCALTGSPTKLYCDPPLRGGIFMTGGPEGCTAGFLVFGNTGGNPFVMTAGHCLTAANGAVWNTHFADGSSHAIGAGHSKLDGPAGDYGIVGIQNPSGWSATCCSRVWVAGVPGQTTQDSFYSITTALYAPAQLVVCNTSGVVLPSGYHGSCGIVQSGTYVSGGVSGLYKVSGMCALDGSSGGPVFKAHIAYGVVIASDGGGCPTYYQAAPNAMSASNVHLG